MPESWVTHPHISLIGEVNDKMLRTLLQGLRNPPQQGDLVIEVSTSGGDAEIGRRMASEVIAWRNVLSSHRLIFVGKTNVYSAGVTLMSAFPVKDRYLTEDAVLLIHERQVDKEINLSGPISSSLTRLNAICAELEIGLTLERRGFERLIEGSLVSWDVIAARAPENWYLPAAEALALGLIADVLSSTSGVPGGLDQREAV